MRSRITSLIFIVLLLATGSAFGQREISSDAVTDIILEANNGGYHVIFYDSKRNICVTSGSITLSKKVIRLKDVPKMEGRGVNQQIVLERQTHEEYEPILSKMFTAADFRKVKVGVGEGAMALPLKLPNVTRGDQVKISFGNIRKSVVVGW